MEVDKYLQEFLADTSMFNSIVLGHLLPSSWWVTLPHFLQTWLRNYIAGTLLYFISGFLWCFYIYYLKRNVYVPKDTIPSNRAMLLQIYVAMKAMPWYTLLPTVSEYMIENGWTKCFSSISEIGWFAYIIYFLIYLVIVEFGIYWMHRELHDIKPLYKYLHATHHIYNKQNTLSPFAGKFYNALKFLYPNLTSSCNISCHFPSGSLPVYKCYQAWHSRDNEGMPSLANYCHITLLQVKKKKKGLAFHPIDGILQAVPHVIALFLVPTHFRSHVALLFIEAIWTANIHDCIHANLWPVMGAGYHTIHHTTYKHNYGHYTIWMDWMLGTLRDPEDDSCQRAQKVR
ncbi:hypothetical protein NC652_011060 [Populus alba x Populus x berolinensis]|nr:hypothetical protein NC652_011056 [Populus alba x Populus x berolinensis]KAJ6936209.1 hypothetical protein NC652_011060 [Populus alba x Populus x berolinensis]